MLSSGSELQIERIDRGKPDTDGSKSHHAKEHQIETTPSPAVYREFLKEAQSEPSHVFGEFFTTLDHLGLKPNTVLNYQITVLKNLIQAYRDEPELLAAKLANLTNNKKEAVARLSADETSATCVYHSHLREQQLLSNMLTMLDEMPFKKLTKDTTIKIARFKKQIFAKLYLLEKHLDADSNAAFINNTNLADSAQQHNAADEHDNPLPSHPAANLSVKINPIYIDKINAYLMDRASETNVGIRSMFGYSANDYQLRRNSWLSILHAMLTIKDKALLLETITTEMLEFSKGKSKRYAHGLQLLLSELSAPEVKIPASLPMALLCNYYACFTQQVEFSLQLSVAVPVDKKFSTKDKRTIVLAESKNPSSQLFQSMEKYQQLRHKNKKSNDRVLTEDALMQSELLNKRLKK